MRRGWAFRLRGSPSSRRRTRFQIRPRQERPITGRHERVYYTCVRLWTAFYGFATDCRATISAIGVTRRELHSRWMCKAINVCCHIISVNSIVYYSCNINSRSPEVLHIRYLNDALQHDRGCYLWRDNVRSGTSPSAGGHRPMRSVGPIYMRAHHV